jgi:hypothetical protein
MAPALVTALWGNRVWSTACSSAGTRAQHRLRGTGFERHCESPALMWQLHCLCLHKHTSNAHNVTPPPPGQTVQEVPDQGAVC